MSVDAIKKFLENAKDYPDATEITIGDQKIPLGSLRSLNATERQELETALKANQGREQQLEADRKRVLETGTTAAQVMAEVEELKKKYAAVPTGADPWKDPWLAPVDERFKKELEARDKQIADLLKVAAAIPRLASIYTEDRYDNEFNSLNFGKREKKPTRDEILKFATDNKIVDRHGIPSIRGAWDKMSETDRLKDLEEQAFERGKAAREQEMIAARIPPPGVPGPGMSTPVPKITPQSDILGDLWADVQKDPELRELASQLPSGFLQ